MSFITGMKQALRPVAETTLRGVSTAPEKLMRVLVTGGGSGRVGPGAVDAIKQIYPNSEISVTSSNPSARGAYHTMIDSLDSVARTMAEVKPDIVIHSAALSSGSIKQLRSVNVGGTGNIIKVANDLGVPVIYTSSVAADMPVERLGPELAPYACTKKEALEVAKTQSNDITILSVGALIGDATVKGATPSITDLAGLNHMVRLELADKEDGSRIIQPTTYDAVSKAIGRIAVDKFLDESGSTGVVKLNAVGDPMELNELLRACNPLAPVTATIESFEGMMELLKAHNHGVIAPEFAHLDTLPQGAEKCTRAFKELLQEAYPGAEEVKETARAAMSIARAANIGKSVAGTMWTNGSFEMLRGLVRTAVEVDLSLNLSPMKMQYLSGR